MMAFLWFKVAVRDFGFKSRDQPGPPQYVAEIGDGFPSKFIRRLFNSNLSLCIVAVMCRAFIALAYLGLITSIFFVRSNTRLFDSDLIHALREAR